MTNIPIPLFKLNTGATIPAIGLGGWGGHTKEQRESADKWFLTGLEAGYRHIDTAWIYGTEGAVGRAIRASGIPREEVFVTTKLSSHQPGHVQEAIDESLKNSGLDYFDLYLIHWPQTLAYENNNPYPTNPDGSIKVVDKPTFNETWADMEKVLASGKVKAIGVSNFSIKTLEQLLKTAKVVPAVNQVELHPYLAQNDLIAYCKEKGIVVTAYTPTGYGTVRGNATIVSIAKKNGITPVQVILGWHVARGVVAVPRSMDINRQKENLTLISLSEEDRKRVDALDRNERLCNKADETGKVDGWTYEQLGW